MQNQIIVIETPRGSFVKRNEHYDIDFVSPLPCPFNYGHCKGELGGDGDPLDGILLGRRQSVKTEISATVVGCVRFLDDSQRDDKWILSDKKPTKIQKKMIVGFFGIYVQMKKFALVLKGRKGVTKVELIEYF